MSAVSQITQLNQHLFASNNLSHDEINLRLTQAVLASPFNALPSVDLLKYTAGVFNLYSAPNLPFQPSIAVRAKLLELAGATRANSQSLLNFSQLFPQDLAAIYRILNAYSMNEEALRPGQAVFPFIVQNLRGFLVFLCQDDRGAQVLATLRSYQDPLLAQITAQMVQALEARVRRQEPVRFEPSVQAPQLRPQLQEPVHVAAQEVGLVEQLLGTNDRLTEENERLTRELRQTQEANVQLVQQLFAGEPQQQQAGQASSSHGQIESLRRQVLRAEQDKEFAEALVAQQKKDYAVEISGIGRDLTEKDRQLQVMTQERNDLEGDLERSSRDLKLSQEREAEAIRRYQASRKELERIPELEKQIQGLSLSPPAQASSAAVQVPSVASLDPKAVRELRDRNADLLVRNGELDRQVKDLSGQLGRQRASTQTVTQEAKAAREENARLKQRIAELEAAAAERK